jgi:hypothetical protein
LIIPPFAHSFNHKLKTGLDRQVLFFHKRRFPLSSILTNPALAILFEGLVRLSRHNVGFPTMFRCFLFWLFSSARLFALCHTPLVCVYNWRTPPDLVFPDRSAAPVSDANALCKVNAQWKMRLATRIAYDSAAKAEGFV